MEMTNQPPMDPMEKKVKISLADLPPGTKEGDSLSMKVSSINQATGVAYMTAVSGDSASAAPEASADSEPQESSESDGEENPKDTSVLLGPMDGLKNYLVQKSMDVPKNQGR